MSNINESATPLQKWLESLNWSEVTANGKYQFTDQDLAEYVANHKPKSTEALKNNVYANGYKYFMFQTADGKNALARMQLNFDETTKYID